MSCGGRREGSAGIFIRVWKFRERVYWEEDIMKHRNRVGVARNEQCSDL